MKRLTLGQRRRLIVKAIETAIYTFAFVILVLGSVSLMGILLTALGLN